MLAVQSEANRKMKEQLKRQFEIQQEVLHDKLKAKDLEVSKMIHLWFLHKKR